MAGFRDVKIGWRTKAFAFNILDRIPYGEQLYAVLQHRVTRTLPRKLSPTKATSENQLSHLVRSKAHLAPNQTLKLLEFGGGWDLYSNLLYYCLGLDDQVVVDVRKWANHIAINAVIDHLKVDPPEGYVRLPHKNVTRDNIERDLKEFYGITYRAPFDATNMDYNNETFDVIVTTSVFEHIPKGVLESILSECRRVIKPNGLMSHIVDYSDHYSHADGDINEFNYLAFSEGDWKSYNPSIHYQNRLRTPDYLAVLANSDFNVVDKTEWKGSLQQLEKVPLDPSFKNYSIEELTVLGCHFIAAPC